MSDAAPASSQPNIFSLKAEDRQNEPPVARTRKELSGQDRTLIARAQSGDIGAFNDLIQKYEKPVFNFAYRLTSHYDDAHDVAQDAFVRAFNAINSFRGDASFTTWLFRITTNVFLDERKKRKAHPVQSLDEYVQHNESTLTRQVEDHAPGPEAITTDKERIAVLNHAIQQLPEYQRTMVVMYHMEQKSYEEIAEVMEVPIGTVKSRLNRARLALKDLLTSDRELLEG
jgi:RNA polymerase sigma-70 factor (ECF subfamily)